MSYKVQELLNENIQLKAILTEKDQQYNDLMAQAVNLAKLLMTSDDEFKTYTAGDEFLKLPSVQAWRARKEAS